MNRTEREPGGPRSEHITVGAVGKPFGVRGDVYVFGDPDLDEPFPPGARYVTADGQVLIVATSRLHGIRRLVRFAGVHDREAAEALRGSELRLPRTAVALAEDAVWIDDLLGRDVVDERGAVLGAVEAVRDGPAHDYLVIARPDGGEALIPFVEALVDTSAEAIVVRAIPGLLDLP